VLVAGGETNAGFAASAELYDPMSGTFAYTGSMSTARDYQTATLLLNGKVLIAGGANGNGSFSSTELYDPATGTFSAGATMTTGHSAHTAALLANGMVLVAGGYNNFTGVATAELYDAGAGFADARRPVITTQPNRVCQPGTLALTGLLFTGDSEGSSGSTSSSPSNAPLLLLQRVDNNRISYASMQSFSATTFNSTALSGLDSGIYRASIVSNAIPAEAKMLDLAYTPVLPTYPANIVVGTGSSVSLLPSSLPADGAFYPMIASASSGFTGTVRINPSTGVVSLMSSGPAGSYTITISSSTGCGSRATSFVLDVVGPTQVVATATGPNTVVVTFTQAFDVSYTIARVGAGGTTTNFNYGPANYDGLVSFTDTSAAANTAYLYKVAVSNGGTFSAPDLATTVMFTDPTIIAGSTIVKAAHITELRTAVNAVRTLAGIGAVSFTDPALTAGSTPVKAVHLTQLRSALDAARSSLLLSAATYSAPAVSGGAVTKVNIDDLRNGVK
jgi:hypothetical protein